MCTAYWPCSYTRLTQAIQVIIEQLCMENHGVASVLGCGKRKARALQQPVKALSSKAAQSKPLLDLRHVVQNLALQG